MLYCGSLGILRSMDCRVEPGMPTEKGEAAKEGGLKAPLQ
jgi:hypothetical protein